MLVYTIANLFALTIVNLGTEVKGVKTVGGEFQETFGLRVSTTIEVLEVAHLADTTNRSRD
jgi:tmRNA-binding protein